MKRVLIHRLGSLGDSVIALPCFHFLRHKFPEAQITLLTNVPVTGAAPPLQAILEHTGTFDEVLAYPVGLNRLPALRTLRTQLAARNFDLAVSLADARGLVRSVRDWLFFKACGIPRIVGMPFRQDELRCQPVRGTDAFEWEAERIFRRLAPLGAASVADAALWDLRLTPAEQAGAERLLNQHAIATPFLALAAGTKVPAKDWGEARWAEVVKQLAPAHADLPLVLLGSHEERARNDRLAQMWPGPVANLAGECSPRVSAAVLTRARLFAGVDSGPMHLAGCVGVPCVIVFSARSLPGQWHPRPGPHTILYRRPSCFGCALDECTAHGLKCLTSISVEEVVAALRAQLAQGSHLMARRETPALSA
jgi:ADP-heptose:LPS heptosyltransferase